MSVFAGHKKEKRIKTKNVLSNLASLFPKIYYFSLLFLFSLVLCHSHYDEAQSITMWEKRHIKKEREEECIKSVAG